MYLRHQTFQLPHRNQQSPIQRVWLNNTVGHLTKVNFYLGEVASGAVVDHEVFENVKGPGRLVEFIGQRKGGDAIHYVGCEHKFGVL